DWSKAFDSALESGMLEYMRDLQDETTRAVRAFEHVAEASSAVEAAQRGHGGVLREVASAMSWTTAETGKQLNLAMKQLANGKRVNQLTFEQQQLLGMIQSLLGWNLTSEAAIAQMIE